MMKKQLVLWLVFCAGAALLFSANAPTAALQTPPAECIVDALPEATAEATAEVTPEATPTMDAEDAPLEYLTLEPFDLKFNPNEEQPFAVIMNFTLFFQNRLQTWLEVRRPRFTLTIEGVDWGDLVSTDFQMGQIQGGARQGIVLQSLTILNRATDAQMQVLDCIRDHVPVDLALEGSLEAYPNDERQVVAVQMRVEDVVFEPNE